MPVRRGLISAYTSLWICGLYLLSLTYLVASTSKAPIPPASLTRFQNAFWLSVIGTPSALNGPSVRSEIEPR